MKSAVVGMLWAVLLLLAGSSRVGADVLTQAQVMQKIYDVLFAGYTAGGSIGYNNALFLCLNVQGFPIDDEFANPWTPSHPDGSSFATEKFSRFVDAAPALQVPYTSQYSLEEMFGYLVQGEPIKAHADVVNDEYYLYVKEREKMNAAFDALRGIHKPPVLTESRDKRSVATILNQANLKYQANTRASLRDPGSQYHPSYAVPEDWYSLNSNAYTHVTMDFTSVGQENANFQNFGGPQTWGNGLWYNNSSRTYSTTSNLSISFDFVHVTIDRPWISQGIFALGGYRVDGFPALSYSTGVIDKNNTGLMPLYADGFIAIKDLKVQANWSQQELDLISSAADLTWGSFRIRSTNFASTMQNQTLTAPGVQVIAWTTSVIHACPPAS